MLKMHNKNMEATMTASEHANAKKDSISIALVHEALFEAEKQGYAVADILKNAGINSELLSATKARVSVNQYAHLWTELANVMNDEFFGMDRHAMRRGSFQFLSKSLLHTTQLDQAIQHILQFMNLVLDDFSSQLMVQEHYAYIVIYERQQPKRMFSYATYIMLIHALMCWLVGQRVILNQIQLKCDAPTDDIDYKVRFCENIQYQMAENYIQFDANYLKMPIKQDSKSWYQFIQQTPHILLTRYKNPHSTSSQIRRYLMQEPPIQWLELSEIAHHFNMSEATIQRRLKSEGFSYQQLKNDIRRDMAIELLSDSQVSLQDISTELNFHDPSAFHRAFKKWTGVSPSAYRQNKDA